MFSACGSSTEEEVAKREATIDSVKLAEDAEMEKMAAEAQAELEAEAEDAEETKASEGEGE